MGFPLVIAHRGASGYRPENTIAAFEFGLDQGADGIEFDLVTTSDNRLIIRHENALAGTTNISRLQQFWNYKRFGEVEEQKVEDWFTEDLKLVQIKELKAIERLADQRPGSAKFDEQFEIPTFLEVLNNQKLRNKMLVAEIKTGTHLNNLANPVWELMIHDLAAVEPIEDLVIESFDREILESTSSALNARGISAKYFYLLEHGEPEDYLDEISRFDGVSISIEMLSKNKSWVEKVHTLGKQIWVYTARAESATTSIEEYYLGIVETGVDGIFADQPDLLRRVLADSSGSAYDY